MSSPSPLALTVDRARHRALPGQVADQVRTAIRDGALRVGDRLPSTRALAREIGVSRAVVEQAYDQLHAEGWVSGRHGSGTFVHDVAAPVAVRPSRVPARRQSREAPARSLVSLGSGTPWRDPSHDDGWRRVGIASSGMSDDAFRDLYVILGEPLVHGLGVIPGHLENAIFECSGSFASDPDETVKFVS